MDWHGSHRPDGVLSLQDMLDVVDLDGKREHSARPSLNVGGFDLIWDAGPVMRFNQPTSLPSLLGGGSMGCAGVACARHSTHVTLAGEHPLDTLSGDSWLVSVGRQVLLAEGLGWHHASSPTNGAPTGRGK